MTNTMRCPKCGEEKDRTAFSPGNKPCKSCKNKYAKEKYWNDPVWRERFKAEHRQREREKRADPVRNAVILARLKAKWDASPERRQHIRDTVNAHRRNTLGRHMAGAARRRARKRGILCTITPSWAQELWERAPSCAFCGIALRTNGKLGRDSASLDRLLCDEGYTPENTVLACWRCNNLKRDATPEELEQLAANLRRVLNERQRP